MRIDGQLNLEVSGHRIALDTSGSPGQACFVSHAHSDHIAALKNPHATIIASDETLALAGAENKRAQPLEGIRTSLLPSGHMLGSSQLRVEWDSQSFTYTGDFKLGESLTAKTAEVKETEKLLIEGTFGNPNTKFPERSEVYDSISKFVSKNYNACPIFILLGAPLGVKARRGGVGIGFGVSLAFFVVYYLFLVGGEELADRGFLSPFLAMWAANILLGVVGVFLTFQTTREFHFWRKTEIRNLKSKIQN